MIVTYGPDYGSVGQMSLMEALDFIARHIGQPVDHAPSGPVIHVKMAASFHVGVEVSIRPRSEIRSGGVRWRIACDVNVPAGIFALAEATTLSLMLGKAAALMAFVDTFSRGREWASEETGMAVR